MGQINIFIGELYNVHVLTASSEISGQFVENSGFKKKGDMWLCILLNKWPLIYLFEWGKDSILQ